MKSEMNICLTRSSNGTFGLTIEDRTSGVQFVDIDMDAEQFADFMSTRHVGVTGEIRGLERVGMRHEWKQEEVPCKLDYVDKSNAVKIKAVLAPFEVDGWHGRAGDLFNGHCRVGPDVQRVHFSRHVNPETGKPVTKETP